MNQLMERFIPADELKSKFDVFGHFYSVQVAPKRYVECRSVLEIVDSASAPRETVRGLLKEGTINKFLHPLPSLQSQQVQWVKRMVEQCKI